jgi:hypothetical protein
MRCFFEEPRGSGRGDSQGEDDCEPGLAGVSAALLDRHGARVLTADAAEVPGWPAPRSTVYRARTLLIPGDLLQEPALGAIRRALVPVGLSLTPVPDRPKTPGQPEHGDRADAGSGPSAGRDDADSAGRQPADGSGADAAGAAGRSKDPGAGALRRLPRAAVLRPAEPEAGHAALPTVVDAWAALQALRATATAGTEPALDIAAVRRISLEHLLTSSAISGSPIWNSSGVSGSPIWNSSGVTGPGSTDSYLYGGGDARTPVAVCLDAPWRQDAADCELSYGRRPVVAVLDTGVRGHAWLDVQADPAQPGRYVTDEDGDGFVAVDQPLQDAIHAESEQAAAAGDQPRQLIRYPWDSPVTADPLVGELDTDTGHGTFIAGIVRQVAPDAQVLSVRITHSDGMVYEGDLTCALRQLASRIAAGEAGDLAAMVDVISLSLGYFSESEADVAYTSGLWDVIELLLRMGVVVVAAAGNFSTTRRFYPAAFAGRPTPADQVPLISVGALNPNGSKALFSDGGRWITAWATGAAMISTFPDDVNGSRDPQVSVPAGPAFGGRQALDSDDFSSGFAIWSGTSFSAPVVAAWIAAELMSVACDDQALRLDQPGASAAVGRATQALRNLGWRPW